MGIFPPTSWRLFWKKSPRKLMETLHPFLVLMEETWHHLLYAVIYIPMTNGTFFISTPAECLRSTFKPWKGIPSRTLTNDRLGNPPWMSQDAFPYWKFVDVPASHVSFRKGLIILILMFSSPLGPSKKQRILYAIPAGKRSHSNRISPFLIGNIYIFNPGPPFSSNRELLVDPGV